MRVYWALKEVLKPEFSCLRPELSVQGERSVKKREKSRRKVAIRLSIEIKINMHNYSRTPFPSSVKSLYILIRSRKRDTHHKKCLCVDLIRYKLWGSTRNDGSLLSDNDDRPGNFFFVVLPVINFPLLSGSDKKSESSKTQFHHMRPSDIPGLAML